MHHRPDIDDETGQGGRSPRKATHSRRLAKAALLGGFIALLTRSGVRGRVLDKLFGPEEEFEYESETDPEPLTDLSADPASVAEEAEDHGEEEPDAPAADEPRDAAVASWEPAGAPDAVPRGPESPPAPAEDAEPASAPAQSSEPPFAAAGPRIFAVPSVPATDPRGDEYDSPPASGDTVRDAPASYVPTPPASYVQDPPASDVPADLEPEAPEPPSAPAESPAETDSPYSWGGEERSAPVVEFLAPRRDDETEPDAPPPPRALTEPASQGSLLDTPAQSLVQEGAEASDDGAPEAWTPDPPFVVGEDPADREPEAEPWRTAPSIVIENGDLIVDPEPEGALPTPWSSSDTNGGGTPRPSAGFEPEAAPASSTIAPDDAPALPTADAWSTDTLAGDPPSETVASTPVEPASTTQPASTPDEPPSTPVEAASTPVEPAVAETEPVVAAGEPTVGAAEATAADAAPAPGADQATVGITEQTVGVREPSTAPASAESAAATSASADGAVATAERGEPGIGEAAPRRSGWWLSRRRRGAVPEPPSWD